MPTKTKTTTDSKKLLAEIKALREENEHLGHALSVINTKQSRLLAYPWMTLEKARQIGLNIEATIDYASGDLTKAEYLKAVKTVGP